MTTTDKSRADALTGPYSTRHRSVGDWLRCELMDYCKERGIPPADNDRLFAIVDQDRAAWDRPVEQHEAAPAGYCERAGGCVCGGDLPRVREGCSEWVSIKPQAAPLEGTGNGADDFAHELWAAAQLAPSEGISDGVQRIVAALSRAPRTEVAGTVLSGDASECLMAVVSHHRDFVNACKVMHFDAINDDSDAYWEKQIDVLNRMKAQAERALSEPSADAAAAPKAFTDMQITALRVAAEALVERYAEPIRAILRDAEHAAAAPADERAAFESWWVRDVPEQYRAETLRLLRQSRELDGKYGIGKAEGAWEVWQAARSLPHMQTLVSG